MLGVSRKIGTKAGALLPALLSLKLSTTLESSAIADTSNLLGRSR